MIDPKNCLDANKYTIYFQTTFFNQKIHFSDSYVLGYSLFNADMFLYIVLSLSNTGYNDLNCGEYCGGKIR